jgi:hypothetical protein
MWWMYFVPIYENRRINPVEITLKSGEKRGKRESDGQCKFEIYYKRICKYHSVSPCITIIYK